MHLFGANLSWSKKLLAWEEAGVVAEGKDSKTDDRGATKMFIGCAERKSDTV